MAVWGENINKIVLTNLTFPTPVSMTFYGLLPEEISETHTANFESIDIMSRSSPLAAYSGGGARTTSLQVTVHEDYLADFNGGKADIRDYIAKFKALTYPEYMGTYVVPPMVLLRVGNFIKLKGYCTQTSVTWKKPIRDNRYIVADLSIDITESVSNSFAASEIYNKEDLRRV